MFHSYCFKNKKITANPFISKTQFIFGSKRFNERFIVRSYFDNTTDALQKTCMYRNSIFDPYENIYYNTRTKSHFVLFGEQEKK